MRLLLLPLLLVLLAVLAPPAQAQTDYDANNDGLIEITTLSQLNVIRYDLDGDGTASSGNETAYATAFPVSTGGSVCPSGTTCTGYELTADLDFDENGDGEITSADSAYWNGGSGWEPIGDDTSANARYNTEFEGNGFTIANLFFSRGTTGDTGLFGAIGTSANVRNLGLTNVSTTGQDFTGALVGSNYGTVTRTSATGAVNGRGSVGGLVGANLSSGRIDLSRAQVTVAGTGEGTGGLVGRATGFIAGSYATGSVSGGNQVGGLAGRISRGTISNSYATGSVSGGNQVGGLVGNLRGTLTGTYATGRVNGSSEIGGLIGGIVDAEIFNSYATGIVSGSGATVNGLTGSWNGPRWRQSYFDSDTSGISRADVVNVPKTSAELQGPTSASGIYSDWNATDWDFGTSSQYPALKVDFDGNGTATWQEFGYQLRETPGALRTTVATDLASVSLEWTAITNAWTRQRPAPVFSYVVYRQGMGETEATRVAPAAGRTLTQTSYTDRTATSGETYTYSVAVEVNGVELWRSREVEVTISRDKNGNGLIEITTRAQLNAMRYDLNGDGTVDDAANANAFAPLAPAGGSACPARTTCTGYELDNDLTLSGSWNPIGGDDPVDTPTPSTAYTATFDGNGKALFGLRISKRDRQFVGLFGALGSGATVRNVGLVNVHVAGRATVGALVGRNAGTVHQAYVTGTVAGNAHVGGLVGSNAGTIESSYTTASVSGVSAGTDSVRVAGLVGLNRGLVRNTYAEGSVSGHGHAAGLVGWNDGTNGHISNSYARGSVSGTALTGGLVGWQTAEITASYWDTQTSGQAEGAGQGDDLPDNAGQTTAGLQTPTSATGIYTDWDASIWDFGTASDYPRLKADFDNNGTATAAEFEPASPPVTGGGGGGGGAEDEHGNRPSRATRVAFSTVMPRTVSVTGRVNTARDVDYFTLDIPRAGVLVVETTGSTDTVGTLWQQGEELATATLGGARRNFRLSAPVQPGPVVMAVEGNGGRTGPYTLEVRLVVGYLGNPGPTSRFQSGVGVISGWVCEADEVVIEIDGTQQHEAAYGTERTDTESECGDTDNGFGLLFNWNHLADGEHEVVAVVDGEELGRATVTTTRLDEEIVEQLGQPIDFVRGLMGEAVVEDFPVPGESVRVVWQQGVQNFMLAPLDGGSPEQGPGPARPAGLVGYLGNPGPTSQFQSGVGIISGWVCEAEVVIIEIDGTAQHEAAYGTERPDTLEECGDTDNGFGLLFNWNHLPDGEHEVVAFVDGVELGRATVTTTPLDEEVVEQLGQPIDFVRGVAGEAIVEDFPVPGESVRVVWQEGVQNFMLAPRE